MAWKQPKQDWLYPYGVLNEVKPEAKSRNMRLIQFGYTGYSHKISRTQISGKLSVHDKGN